MSGSSVTRAILFLLCMGSLGSFVGAQVRHDLYIHVRTGDSLDATYYTPSQSPPAGGYPVIIFVHGYGFDKYAVIATCSTYALSGYLTLGYTVRGHGNSSGYSKFMSDVERKDLKDVLAWLRSLPEVDAGSIGISGGSQGGLHGLWAAADRLPVKAVTSDVIVPHWASDMLSNGCIRRTALLLLQGSTVRYDAMRDTLWDFVRNDQFDSLRSHFIPGRDIDTALLNSSSLPTLRLFKWQDHYFASDDGIEGCLRYAGAKKVYIGARGHFSDLAESERIYQYDQVTRWLDYFLRGVQNGILTDPTYTYAYSALPMDTSGFFQWTRVEGNSWPPAGIQRFRCYLHKDSTISFTPPISLNDSLTLSNRYLNPAYTFDTAYIEGFRGPRFDVLVPKQTLVFDSPPLPEDVTWLGVPGMKLYVRSDHEKFPLHAQIYELDSAGARHFVNRINYTARHWLPGEAGVVSVEGIPHAHKFTRGSRIHIELTNIDVTNRVLLGTFPFVVPMLEDASVTISMDALHQSYIELPLIGTPTEVSQGDDLMPEAVVLYQNYPNPFNPTTSIEYKVASKEYVRLKVYDVLGRKVATIVDKVMQPGVYSVSWEASGVSTGIYFYRLEAGQSAIVKKMIVVK